jgi:hypothetical protein
VIKPPECEIAVLRAAQYRSSSEKSVANGIVSVAMLDFKHRRCVNMPTPVIDYHRAWSILLKKGESN